MYVSPKEAAEYYGVIPNTIRTWADQGKIQFIKTDGGHRRYLIEDKDDIENERRRIIYCRVSSRKQKKDLERQTEFLRKHYPDHEVITDIGSGINFKRPGFIRILEELFDGNIEEVVVAHRDRFSRIGFEFFEWLFQKFESKITTFDKESESQEKELSKDLMEIITIFSARINDQHSHKNNEDKIRVD